MKFLIVGGDKRNIRLIELLKKDGHEIKTYGLEISELSEKDIIKDIEELQNIKDFHTVIGPIPFTIDGENLNAPFAENEIILNKLLPVLENKTLIAGPISDSLQAQMVTQNIKVIDSMKIEELVIYNTIATAEGAIEVAIANTEKNLHDSKILILGFGRVAKTLAIKLSGLSQYVACAARKKSDLTWIETLGYNVENINNLEHINDYDILINTVPQIILKEEKIKNIKKDALYIELASKPGGIEPDAIKTVDFKYISAQGLPGKIAPLASAKYIKQAVYNIIKNNK